MLWGWLAGYLPLMTVPNYPSMAALAYLLLTMGGCASTKGNLAMTDPIWTSSDTLTGYCTEALTRAKAAREALRAAEGGPDTLDKYNRMLIEIDNAMGWSALHFQVHPEEAIREAAGTCKQQLAELGNDITLDRGLFDAMAAVDTSAMDGQSQRFAQRVLRDFRRSGVDKDDATRGRLKALHGKMVKLGQDFQTNVRADVRHINIDDPAKLDGLPEDWIAAHKPEKAGGPIQISTDYPDFFPFQTYCKDGALRRTLYAEFGARGYPANKPILAELLKLRAEYAKLLGYASWAAYDAEVKMVKNTQRVDSFLKQLTAIAQPRAKADLAELLEAKRKDEADATAVEVWDRFFYTAQVREEKYDFDAREVRAYFPYQQVKAGLLEVYSELFGLEFAALPDEPVWHEDVEAWSLKDNGKEIARFYLDMHPRAGKYKHAAMFGIQTGLGGGQTPRASLVCNFPNPRADGKALMEHTQVVTFFHEFGHLLHHLLAREARYINLGGINVEWDFVEAPSQILEEWAWDHSVLSRFAKHSETGKAITPELVQRMRASEEFGKGAQVMRQLFYAAYSFFLHAEPPETLDLERFTDDMYARFSPYPRLEGGRVYANFGHLIGYSSAYYTYQWSLVIAKDMFTRFKKNGMMDRQTARDYVEKILEPGGMRDADDLVTDFLGRDYTLDAYRAWLED
ncbi:MAG: thimet oligopeptidase [Myxococcota bacterium]